MVTFHSDRGKEALWSSQFKIEIEKPINRPGFRGRGALWLPSIEKPIYTFHLVRGREALWLSIIHD